MKNLLPWLLMSFISIALASDSPPATLPKGFLEQLPTLEKIEGKEFEVFMQYVAEQNKAKKKTTDEKQQKNEPKPESQEGILYDY